MEVLGVYAGASRMMDKAILKTRMGVKGLSHETQGVPFRHQLKTTHQQNLT